MTLKKYLSFGLLFYLHYQLRPCSSDSITYISTERPAINWLDKKYCTNFTMISKRLSRQDPRYYVEIYITSLIRLDNNLKLDFYFYQFLTNRYRPSFVEMHFRLCDMMNSDSFFGQTMRNALGGRTCPYPAGSYYLKNLSIPYVPKGFPFTKGRIYCNVTLTEGNVSKLVGSGYIDMEIKVAKINRKVNKSNLL